MYKLGTISFIEAKTNNTPSHSPIYMLWQLLNQCLIATQTVNLIGGIFSRNTSCVFTRELDREPQQYSTDYLYKVPWSMLQLYIILP